MGREATFTLLGAPLRAVPAIARGEFEAVGKKGEGRRAVVSTECDPPRYSIHADLSFQARSQRQ